MFLYHTCSCLPSPAHTSFKGSDKGSVCGRACGPVPVTFWTAGHTLLVTSTTASNASSAPNPRVSGESVIVRDSLAACARALSGSVVCRDNDRVKVWV